MLPIRIFMVKRFGPRWVIEDQGRPVRYFATQIAAIQCAANSAIQHEINGQAATFRVQY